MLCLMLNELIRASDSRIICSYNFFPKQAPWSGLVHKINPYQIYQLGQAIQTLLSIPDSATISEAAFSLSLPKWTLERFVEEPEIHVPLSSEAAKSVLLAISKCERHYFQSDGTPIPDKDWGEHIPSWEISSVKQDISRFEHLIAAELAASATYHVSGVGIFVPEKLIENAHEHIPANIRSAVPENAILEIKSAGRALALDLPTAAGFHVLRGLECVMEEYYCYFAGGEAKQFKSWGECLIELDKLCKSGVAQKPSKKSIRHLRQIKDLDRNPLMHPEDILSINEAFTLFNMGLTTITSMVQELIDLRSAAMKFANAVQPMGKAALKLAAPHR